MSPAFWHLQLLLLCAFGSIHSGFQRLQTKALYSDHVQRSVRCRYFKAAPVGTYCILLARNSSITGEDAQKACLDIGMTLLNNKTTSLDRVASLIRVFALHNSKFWWADELNETHLAVMYWCGRDMRRGKHVEEVYANEDEKLKLLDENVTTPDFNYTFCNTAVICEAGFYQSNGPSCVTVEENSGVAEYCYVNERGRAADSHLGCQVRGLHLMDTEKLNGTEILNYLRRLVRTDLEFWVDLKKEDVANLSGVIAFNTEDHNWRTSCVTVWFGRNVPWFFKRNCNESYPIICEDGTSFSNYARPYSNNQDCVHHRSPSGIFGYCIPENRTFVMTAGSQFCDNRSLSLLRGSTLRVLLDLYRDTDQQDRDAYFIWDAGYLDKRHNNRTMCAATNLTDEVPRRERLPCSHPLGYICQQQKPITCVPPHDRVNLSVVHFKETAIFRVEICISQESFTARESFNFCKELGMDLVDENVVPEVKQYFFKLEDETRTFWLWISSTKYYEARDIYWCFCIGSRPCNHSRNCEGPKYHAICYTGYYPDGHRNKCYHTRQVDINTISPRLLDTWNIAVVSDNIEDILAPLKVLTSAVNRTYDILLLPYLLEKVLENFKEGVAPWNEDNTAADTKRLGATLVDIVEQTTLQSKLLKNIQTNRRLKVIFCLLSLLEDFAVDNSLTKSN